MTTMTRVFNFSAGPAVLPLPVLEEAQRDLVTLPGVGMSVMEISHRSKTFEDLLGGAIENIRALANIPANYRILMLQGGASLQFSMVPMNLLPAGGSADYIVTGAWAQKAVKEAKKVGSVPLHSIGSRYFHPASAMLSPAVNPRPCSTSQRFGARLRSWPISPKDCARTISTFGRRAIDA